MDAVDRTFLFLAGALLPRFRDPLFFLENSYSDNSSDDPSTSLSVSSWLYTELLSDDDGDIEADEVIEAVSLSSSCLLSLFLFNNRTLRRLFVFGDSWTFSSSSSETDKSMALRFLFLDRDPTIDCGPQIPLLWRSEDAGSLWIELWIGALPALFRNVSICCFNL